jgi:hypothetical protein
MTIEDGCQSLNVLNGLAIHAAIPLEGECSFFVPLMAEIQESALSTLKRY